MSVHPTITHTPRRLALVGGLLAALAVGSSAAAAHASWTDVSGNPNCAAVGSGYRELKVEPVREGRHSFGDGQLSGVIDVRGVRFDWSANQGVDAVIVKGGPIARIYRAPIEVTRGTGLHAPINPANGAPYGLSHITFCYDVEPPPAPPRTPGPCEPGGATTKPDGQPCTPAPTPTPGPCQPGGATTKPSGEPCTPTPGPCQPGGATTKPDGKPCTPAPTPTPGPCEPGGATTMPDGKPCTPAATLTPGPCQPGGATTKPDGQPCDQGGTTSATAGAVLGASGTAPRVAARARLRTPSRCVTRPFRLVVRGVGIRRVTFSVGGRRVARLAGTRTAYAVKVDPRASATGAMRIRARVEFVAASRKRATTFRATVLRCTPSGAAAQPTPRFAG